MNKETAQSLSAFLIAHADIPEEEVKISDRIPYMFKIKAMDSQLYSELYKANTTISRKGKASFNAMGFNGALIRECCVNPDFKDAEFLKACGCFTPDDAIQRLLRPGEIVNLAGFISELSGFDKTVDDLKDEVKN